MKNKLWILTVVAVLVSAPKAQAACTPTGFFNGATNLTAALINPLVVSTPVNATGCHIGIYYTNGFPFGVITLNKAEVFGASDYGVLVNADVTSSPLVVHLTRNTIHHIGDVPFTAAPHGIGLCVRAYLGHNVTGEANGNTIFAYQKGGIVINGPNAKLAKLDNNQVYGIGRTTLMAQNGIQIGYGAMPYPSEIVGNIVTGNSYIGTPGDGSASAGILVVGGPGFTPCPGGPCAYTTGVPVGIVAALNVPGTNTLMNNDVGVFAYNVAADGMSPPPTPTTVVIVTNLIGSDQPYNAAYLAAISDFGNTDYILANNILLGGGYGPSCVSEIDTVGSLNPQVLFNVPATCAAGASVESAPAKLKPSPAAP